ncbi:MAG: hypothetical protein Q4C12_00180 [Clostridia bacterium]|nr:hypothetical protein [Clostridia bacterium]
MKNKNNNPVCKLLNNIKKMICVILEKRDKEYSKRLLTRIINHSLFMMWASYALAWFGRTDIAETLSKTIVTSVIAVVIGYLTKSVIENISKNTTTFGKNIEMEHNINKDMRDC